MKILSIETSCDDTAITIFEAKGGMQNAVFRVLANNSNSQIKIHVPFGGVYPMLAKREHKKNLPIILEASLKQAKLEKTKKPVNAICVTYGPGLEMCLWEGILFAQDLAKKWGVPLIPVNHMEGHILSVFGKEKGTFKIQKLKTPILSLLVSGGHTQLVLVKDKKMSARGGSALGGDYEIIGETLDDAVGEAFDKVARMLDLPYPGGPEISRLAETVQKSRFTLPRPMIYSNNFNFSFSGLKTSVLYLTKKLGKINKQIKAEIALEFQKAAIECLVYKTRKAIEKYKIKTLIVAGGVAANKHLKNEMKKITNKKIKLLFPAKELVGDNSIMIGIARYLNYIKNKKKVSKLGSIKATGNLRL